MRLAAGVAGCIILGSTSASVPRSRAMATHTTAPTPDTPDRAPPPVPRTGFGTAHPGLATEPPGETAAAAALPVDAAGRYELLDEIARGAMGVVSRATDTALGR